MEYTVHKKKIISVSQNDFWKLAEDGSWEPQSFRLLEEHIVPGKTFVDIGAWNGVLSIYAKLLGANVICVEPDDVALVFLRENINLNFPLPTDIRVIPVAVSDKKGERSLNGNGWGNSNSTIMEVKAFERMGRVMTTTIDEIGIDGDCCLVKMDVEGAEIPIFSSSIKFFATTRPKVYVSFHPAYFPSFREDVERLIDALFPIYNFFGVIYDRKQYKRDEFIAAMKSPHDHSFLLLPK